MATVLLVTAIVLSAISSILHIPAIQAKIKASKTKIDDVALDVVDLAKDKLPK